MFYKGRLTRHWRLIEEFIRCKPLGEGMFHHEVQVGRCLQPKLKDIKYIIDRTTGKQRRIERSDEKFSFLLRVPIKRPSLVKSIDLIYETKDEIWILEAKTSHERTSDAIGQLMLDETLYRKERNIKKPLKLGIICEESDIILELTCKEKQIAIFEKTATCFHVIK
jgi:hypothetical protein